MKHFVKIFSLLLVASLIVTLCSCSVFTYDNSRFEGGETLDEELLSKIENDIRNEDQSTEESVLTKESSSTEESTSIEESLSTQESALTEGSSSDTHETTEFEGSDCDTDTGNETVYWTGSGTVWHVKRDCSYIKNSQNVNSGTIQEAKANGKKQACSGCTRD